MAHDPADNEELRLVRSVLAGDPSATELFVERMRCIPRFLNQRNHRHGRPLSPEDIADLSQEVFAAMWSRLDEFRGEARLETWAYRFCARKYLESGRNRRVSIEFDEHRPEEFRAGLGAGIDDAVVLAALEDLPPEERSVVFAKHFEERSFESIGTHVGSSVNTIKGRYYRALERLRARLGRAFKGAFDE